MSTTHLAYLDAGSASMLLQMIVGGTAAALVTLKLFWGRLLRALHIRKDPPEPPSASETDPS